MNDRAGNPRVWPGQLSLATASGYRLWCKKGNMLAESRILGDELLFIFAVAADGGDVWVLTARGDVGVVTVLSLVLVE